ncbi:shikimate dehydrogenase [Floridanema aerugineum]|jgi:shikimate dehydrogenase|uniref:Shikimate dehydrogenase (NADP(+)) n=1 Tax=Floridaenema aerugineum BLCC-F46 TaxID=3153654 RepID=A0ABV4X947_9CYAN
MITGKTKLLGVIGDPIEHSLSPVMHNAAIAKLQLDYVYLPFPIKPENLPTAISGFAAIGLIGFSVTIPHKQAIIPLLTEVSPIAKEIGAVNTVWRTETGWNGTNTDVEGFLAPLKNYNQNWHQTTALILGYGGAARAVVAGCAQLNCAKIQVVGRDLQKLKAFQNSWQNSQLAVNLGIHHWQQLPDLIGESNLLVNTTPVGMYPHVDESPVSAELMEKLPRNAIAYDLIYTPNPTKFLQIAKEQGANAIDGLEMLIQQGAAALQIWLKQQVPVDVMRQSLRQHLGLIDN